jgi:hypothetical protein
VANLIEGKRLAAGVHEVKFEGTNLSSGIYIYRLRMAADFQNMKLVLLK